MAGVLTDPSAVAATIIVYPNSKGDFNLPTKESDPTGAKPHTPGAKLDAGKLPIMQGVIQYFPRALAAVSGVSKAGADKYTWNGWETVPDGVNRYGNALARHLMAEVTEGVFDKDTGCMHAAQVAWNALAVLELKIRQLERSTHKVATEEDARLSS